MRRLSALALVAASGATLCACSSVNEAVNGPKLTPMNYPAALAQPMPASTPVIGAARQPIPQSASANSLWRTGARAFFIDQRASRVGDILTVLITIDDSAKTTNATSSSRTSSMKAGMPHLLGLEQTLGRMLPGAYDPTNALATSGATSNQGAGAVNRQEKINLTVAAVDTQVLPNGNLMLQGSQEVRTNTEMRQLTVQGVVRPEDITATNTINHSQIAEARISYGGRGDISRVQKTPAGQSLVEKFSPF